MRKVAILGSTGSIGTQTLDVIRQNQDSLEVFSLVAYSNETLLRKQVAEFDAKYSALISVQGVDCLIEAVKGCDVAVIATRGIVAIDAVLYCLDNGIDVALANKETLVCAGQLVMSKIGAGKLYPIDSEHNAISRCILGRDVSNISKLLLTASGGPFWNFEKSDLGNVTASQALKHPNWSMGSKITVDSATMMNKALEVIEAHWLFSVPTDKIQIVVHRQSIIHSMVECADGEVIAQLATPDMRLPIQAALLGESGNLQIAKIDFTKLLTLTFESCDFDKFPCARFGYLLEKYPPLCATVMNASNDICVDNFLQGKLSFTQFYNIILKTIEHFASQVESLDVTSSNIKRYDELARAYAQKLIDGE